MSQLNSKTFWIITSCLALTLLLYNLSNPKIEYKEKVVTKIQERVRTLTKIVVSPDGTQVTTIDERSEKLTDQTAERESSSRKKDWLIGVAANAQAISGVKPPAWGVTIQRRIIFDAYLGVILTPDQPVRLALTYSF